MHRTNIYLSVEQKTRLQAESERTGLSASEITRRALDYCLSLKEDPLEQFAERYVGGRSEPGSGIDALGDLFEMIRTVHRDMTLIMLGQSDESRARMREAAEKLGSKHLLNAIPADDAE